MVTKIKNKITTTQKITSGTAITLSILAIVLSSGLMGQTDVYACQATQIAMHCDKLSKANAEGIQTRCYYYSEELNKTKYKQCSTGWLKYEPKIEHNSTINVTNPVYLVCEKKSKLLTECQIIDSNETIIKVGGN